jgi:YidC/Oxa1 family membrane protein insertase
MNNQKFFLLTAIALSIFLLWDKWQLKQNPPQQTQTINAEQAPSVNVNNVNTGNINNNSEVPNLTSANINIDVNTPNVANTNSLVSVETDLLNIIIDKTGAITNATLKQYPLTINSEEKVKILDNNEKFFIAQGGLAPQGVVPTHLSDNWQVKNSNYTLTNDSLVVPLIWQQNGVIVIKNFVFTRDSYKVDVNYQITNNTNEDINLLSYSRLSRNPIDQHTMVMPTFSGGAIYNDEDIYEKFDFDEFASRDAITTKGGFTAQVEHYFIGAIIPEQNQVNKFSSKVNNNNYILENITPQQVVKANETKVINADSFYLGPKEKVRIDKVVKGLDHTVDYSWLYIIAMPLAEFIYWIYSLVGNWGLAIIILTIVVKLAFYKLSEKSYKSMAGMRKLAPRLETLKEKYGDDRMAMGQKTMELYKEAKVNPASGCLPILVQMPVFIALYWVLIEMVELRHTPFLYVPDLSAADPYYILPVLMGLTMFIQQKLNPKPTDPMQAKIMMSLPIVFTIFFLWFPAGLVLYWLLNNVLSIAQQWVITKRIENS